MGRGNAFYIKVKILRNFLIVCAFLLTLILIVGLSGGKDEATQARELAENRAHCAKNDLVYIQEDPYSSGRCMTLSEGTAAAIKMHREAVDRGIK